MEKKDFLKKFGLNVKFERLRKGFTQEYLAEKANVHRNYISKIENGEVNMSLAKILELSKAMDLDVKILLDFLK